MKWEFHYAVPVEGESALSRLASAVKFVCKSTQSVKMSVAAEITKDLKVEIYGGEIWKEFQSTGMKTAQENGNYTKYHRGTITQALHDGKYNVAMDGIFYEGKTTKYICTVSAKKMRFV